MQKEETVGQQNTASNTQAACNVITLILLNLQGCFKVTDNARSPEQNIVQQLIQSLRPLLLQVTT
jgi:hypothetical protein